ncbi:MAG: T9SS type A sorting domain-containing protein [Bacteroidota bacterium]
MKITKIIASVLIFISTASAYSQVFLSEGFESGLKPEDWNNEFVTGDEPWRYRNGGHSPDDANWQVPADQVDITRNPPGAYEGTYNAIFFKQSYDNERTKLVTPEMNVEGTSALELSFYLCQVPWTFQGTTGTDVLRIYYKVSETAPWILLAQYLDPMYDWELQTISLPNPSESYYVAFEGQTRWGYGACIDNVVIQETASQPMYIGELEIEQPFPNYTPSGSPHVPMLRMDFNVFGNEDSVVLDYIHFNSLNTDDSDILSGGVKLYSTPTQVFNTTTLLGSPTSFNAGVASFTGLSHTLPKGHSYLWLTYDVDLNATHENTLDVMVAAHNISANSTLYPETDQNPYGYRQVYETRYHEDFEVSSGWTLTGEFEIATPDGSGGEPGNPNPPSAYSGTQSLGTDLTGLGANPYAYEPGLNEATSYLATSSNIEALYYKNLNFFYQRYMNVQFSDSANLQISNDNGVTWNTFWTKKEAHLADYQWNQEQILIPDSYARSDQLKIRFRLGPTDGFGNYSGWHIDDIFLTGEFIQKDVGVTEWIGPLSGSGHTASEEVTVRIDNFGGAEITDPVPVAYSFNGGSSWTIDQMDQHIPVGGSVLFTFPTTADLTEPGFRPSVLARTYFPGDQYTENDQISTEIYVVPTFTPPCEQDFDPDDGYWQSLGSGLWEHGNPGGNIITNASSGANCWMTSLSSPYGNVIAQPNETIFEDNFESPDGWTFTGEFERAIPNQGFIPSYAFSEPYCMGIDLSGQGTNFYQYENGITPATAHTATTQALDVSSYSDLSLNFFSWITINQGDSLKLEVSPDNGSTWHTIWKNTEGAIMETRFQYREYEIPDELTLTSNFRIRFSLFHTSAAGAVEQGWSIDDVALTGTLIDSEPGSLVSPLYDLTGLSKPVISAKLWIETEEDVDGATLQYSLNEGATWSDVSNASGFDTYWNWYTGHPVQALGSNGWSGHTGDWIPVTHLLPAAVINQPKVQLRFIFKADKTDNQYDGIALDDIRIMEAPKDVDVIDILQPASACELNSEESFTLRLKNAGLLALQSGDTIMVGYHIDRSGEIQTAEEIHILDQSWAAGTTKDLTMSSLFDFSTSGDYQATVYYMSPEPHFYKAASGDTIVKTIVVNKPYVDLGVDISTTQPDTVVLNADSGVPGQEYLWQDGSLNPTFHVVTEGTYHVRVSNGMGCVAYDTIQVLELVTDVGVTTYLGPPSDCELSNQETLEVIVQNLGTDIVAAGQTIVVGGVINGSNIFDDAVVLTQPFSPGESFNHTYSGSFDFSTPGDYQIQFYTQLGQDLVTGNDTLEHTLQVYGYPHTDLGPDVELSTSEYLLEPGAGYFSYLWQDGSTEETYLVTQPGLGQYYVEVSDEHGCISQDTVIITLNVLDVALDELLSPSTSCELSESITVTVRISNAGNQPIPSGETINLAYQIDGGAVVQESLTLTQNFLNGHTIDFAFSVSESVQTGEWYEFTVYTDYINDSKRTNDTVITSVGVFETPLLDLGEEYQVISGFEHTLDAGAGYISYEWQDGSTNQTYTITEPGVGQYSVTVTDANSCTASDQVQILLVVPDVGIQEVIYPVTACYIEPEGQVQVLVKNFGTWEIESTADITVAYSLNGGLAVSEKLVLDGPFKNGDSIYHTFSQVEDFSVPGTYDIMAYTTYEADMVPVNDMMLVNVNHRGIPDVDIGNGSDTMVVEEPVTLTATPGYLSYQWQDGSTGTDFQITEPSAGWYWVIVNSENGCVINDSVYVAYDQPDMALTRIVTPVTSCDLDAQTVISVEIRNNGYYRISTQEVLTLAYSVDGSTSLFEQFILDTELQPGASVVLPFAEPYDFSAPGTYQVQISFLNEDSNPGNNILFETVTLWNGPVVEIAGGEDTLFTNLPVTLDAGTGFESYLWQDMSTGSTYQVTNNGFYRVEVTDNHGCTASDSVVVTWPVSIGETPGLNGKVKIFPNPATEVLHVALEMEVEQLMRIELYSIVNALIYREDIKQARVAEAHIDVQDLTPGTYLLRVTTDDTPHNFLVIVE